MLLFKILQEFRENGKPNTFDIKWLWPCLDIIETPIKTPINGMLCFEMKLKISLIIIPFKYASFNLMPFWKYFQQAFLLAKYW